jgi:hypothetical protein
MREFSNLDSDSCLSFGIAILILLVELLFTKQRDEQWIGRRA